MTDVKIPVSVKMSEALERAAVKEGITADQLVQRIILEKTAKLMFEVDYDENTRIRVWDISESARPVKTGAQEKT